MLITALLSAAPKAQRLVQIVNHGMRGGSRKNSGAAHMGSTGSSAASILARTSAARVTGAAASRSGASSASTVSQDSGPAMPGRQPDGG